MEDGLHEILNRFGDETPSRFMARLNRELKRLNRQKCMGPTFHSWALIRRTMESTKNENVLVLKLHHDS